MNTSVGRALGSWWDKRSNTNNFNESAARAGVGMEANALVARAREKALSESRDTEEEMIDEEIEEEEAEADYAFQLNSLRTLEDASKEIDALKRRGESFGKPSVFKYFCCGTIAIIKDVLEILALLGTVTIPLAWLLGPMVSIVLVIVFWIFNIKADRANDFIKGLEKDIEIIQGNIAHVVRIASMIPGSRKLAKRGVARLASRVSKSKKVIQISEKIAASPVGKAIWANVIDSAADISTVLQWLPASTIGVILSYLDERRLYKNAAENAKEAHAQLSAQLNEYSLELAEEA